MKRVLISITALLVLGGSSLGFTIWRAVSPTKGAPIDANRPGKALILVDLQEDYTGPKAKRGQGAQHVRTEWIEMAHGHETVGHVGDAPNAGQVVVV